MKLKNYAPGVVVKTTKPKARPGIFGVSDPLVVFDVSNTYNGEHGDTGIAVAMTGPQARKFANNLLDAAEDLDFVDDGLSW